MWWAISCKRVDRLLVWAAGLFGNTKGRMLWTLHFVSMVVQIEYPAAPISSSRKSKSNVPRGETALSRLVCQPRMVQGTPITLENGFCLF